MENEYNLKFAFLKKWEEDLTKREREIKTKRKGNGQVSGEFKK